MSSYLTVRFAPARCRHVSRLVETSLDGSQFLLICSEGCIESGHQGSQMGLSKQIAFDLENQPLELGPIGSRHNPNDKQAISWPLYKTAHW